MMLYSATIKRLTLITSGLLLIRCVSPIVLLSTHVCKLYASLLDITMMLLFFIVFSYETNIFHRYNKYYGQYIFTAFSHKDFTEFNIYFSEIVCHRAILICILHIIIYICFKK